MKFLDLYIFPDKRVRKVKKKKTASIIPIATMIIAHSSYNEHTAIFVIKLIR
jgi:hypothetical protein